jgi:acyl carrier protein
MESKKQFAAILRSIVCRKFKVQDIAPETEFLDIGDSLDSVELTLDVENIFNCILPDAILNVSTVGEFEEIVTKAMGEENIDKYIHVKDKIYEYIEPVFINEDMSVNDAYRKEDLRQAWQREFDVTIPKTAMIRAEKPYQLINIINQLISSK